MIEVEVVNKIDEFIEVKTSDFYGVNDFIGKNWFQIILCNRNILTLIYIFSGKNDKFYIKDRYVYLDTGMEFVENKDGKSYLKADYVGKDGVKGSVEILTLDHFIDYEWEVRR